ncbi:MAG TPA: hypothetical protein VJT31_20935 [Rugosimonospora sp.]|nr:hypothetical protein [Rugosimonospora sp.]
MTAEIITSDLPDTLVAGRRLREYRPLRANGHHPHGLAAIVGYVVRETVRDGVVLWHGEHTGPADVHEFCGYDVAAVEGSDRYGDTFPTRDQYRSQPGSYAVVDSLYACGCRS